MNTVIREVASRIQGLREILDIPEEEMAQLTGLSLAEYQNLEAGNEDFSFTFIFKCAQRFGVEVTDLLKGTSPTLKSYTVTRKGGGLPIARREGFRYNNLAPLFKNKLVEPFWVTAPYAAGNETVTIATSTHEGQEFDLVLKGSLRVTVDGHEEVLNEGDAIYYDSSKPHGMVAVHDTTCEFIAVVMNPKEDYEFPADEFIAARRLDYERQFEGPIYEKYVEDVTDENGVLTDIGFKNLETFNYAFDVVDALAQKIPDKLCMLHLDKHKNERRFTYSDMSRYSSRAANYFKSLGIKRGDRVMLVLKRHYQFWYSLLGLHKLGAIAVPATHLLTSKDYEYRFNTAGVRAIVCTADDHSLENVEGALAKSPTVEIKMAVGAEREGWYNFDEGLEGSNETYRRPTDGSCPQGSDPMLMSFSSGTTGYPKIVTHSYTYPLGHFITAKYWHNVNPEGLHFTISDTGWLKSLWGKLYGQWLCEAAIFTYDFDKFVPDEVLRLFAQYKITTFCAPPTMFRFFIQEDLQNYDLSSLEYATTAGEALNPEVFNKFFEATGLKLKEGFGQTETTLSVCNLVGMPIKLGSMGKPSPLFDVDIVRPDGTSTGIGETGEIVVRTSRQVPPGLFQGYFRDEETTNNAWHDDLYHSGDTAWRDEDGYYWYVGRTDDMIKSSGYRIGPFEIESVIMELPYVVECAVTPSPDPVRGQVVKATVVLTKGTEPSDELIKGIQEYVKKNTAPYKYPRIVAFAESLPKTISGKIRRVELRD